MPEAPTGMPPRPTRRALLAFGGASVVATSLAACGIRLEDDAPRVPLLPTRTPIPGEGFLVALWHHTVDLAGHAATIGGSASALPARLAILHRSQAEVLHFELVRLGVPASVLDATTRPSTTPGTASPTSSPAASSVRGLAAAEASALGPTAIASLAKVSQGLVPLVGSMLAQRAVAARLLGSTVAWPDPTWSVPSLAATYLESTRSAVYGFQVVAAQSSGGDAQRTLADSTLATLQARARLQSELAGAAARPPALAYPLPFPATSIDSARRLATTVLTQLRAAVARDLGSAGGDVGPLGAVVQWLAETEEMAYRWGLTLTPFPGLK